MLNDALAQVELSSELIGATSMTGAVEQEPENYIVQSRFGELSFTKDQVVRLSKPILGFPHLTEFGLARMPNQESQSLLLLQSLEDASVSFPCLGLDLTNPLIEKADLEPVLGQLAIKPDDGAILCILTSREEAGKGVVSANLRAPIFMVSARRTGWQVVLANPRYPIRHAL